MGNDVILCKRISKFTKKDKFSIELKQKEAINGSLKLDSYVRCNMIFTCSKNQILKILCKISKEKYSKIIEKIIKLFL